MIVDVFAHLISPAVDAILRNGDYFSKQDTRDYVYPGQNSQAEVRLALMDKYGVDVQALSQTTPVLIGSDSSTAAEICRLSNSDNYSLCKVHPKRFVNICIFSLLDMKSALDELQRAVDELDCRAVTIATNQDGKGLDSAEFFPFYEKVARYDLPVFLHPTNWGDYPLIDNAGGWKAMLVFGWPFDTTQAVWRLIFGSVLDRFPNLKIITHHCGGMLPYFVRRAEGIARGPLRESLSRPITEYWKQIYGDTGLGKAPAALLCGYEFFGAERMLYGSDYPFGAEAGEGGIRDSLGSVKSMQIAPENIDRILGQNAAKLLKI
jgi:predicted TIM-barrel fold metal-dependent hydrolase